MTKSVCLILGHPSTDSFCGRITDAYQRGASERGAAVERIDVGELRFDPLLHGGYAEEQPLEPDLERAQEQIGRADHLVVIFPTWWGSMPALLKGFFDRVFLPGFAFRYRADSPMWDKLLAGKTGEIIMTADAPNVWTSLAYHNSAVHTVQDAILGFCGVKVRRTTRIGRVRTLDERQRGQWLEKIRRRATR